MTNLRVAFLGVGRRSRAFLGGMAAADGGPVEAIVSAFRDGARIPVTAVDGLDAVRVAEAGEQAIRTGHVIILDSL